MFCLDPASGRFRQIELPGVKDNHTGVFTVFEGVGGKIYASTKQGLFRCMPGETRAAKIREGAMGDMTLEIADNGPGFDPQTALAAGGNGLSNLMQRAAEINGKITFDSAQGRGAQVILTAPLK